MKSFANELGRLAQGIRDIAGTDTINFIPFSEVPKGEAVTYGRIVCMFRPQKDEPNRTRLTVGGNLLVALYDISTPTADLTTAKLLFNSVISTPGARFVTLDLRNFYLKTPLPPRGDCRKVQPSVHRAQRLGIFPHQTRDVRPPRSRVVSQ